MSMPFFSFIVPVYNVRKDYFDVCLQSILSQTISDFEVILVDDGCPNGGGALCDDYARQHTNIRVLHQSNQGVSAARNHGIEMACGEWILFVDADDWVEKDTCAVVKNYIDKEKFDVIHFCGIRETAKKSVPMNYGLRVDSAYDLSCLEDKEYLYLHAINNQTEGNRVLNTMYYSWDKAYRRSMLMEKNIRYPEGIQRSEDKLFVLSCLENILIYRCVPDELYHYRIHNESVCNHYSDNVNEDRVRMFQLLKPIVERMDHNLGKLKNDSNYHKLQDEYNRLVLGMIPDVLRLKYYHKDYTAQVSRRQDVIEFLNTEPFRTSLNVVGKLKLNRKNKIKRILLKHKFIYTHMILCKILDLKRSKE